MKFESLFQIFKERKNELFIIKVIISLILIAFLLWSCNPQSIISELHSVSLISLIPVVFLYIVNFFFYLFAALSPLFDELQILH